MTTTINISVFDRFLFLGKLKSSSMEEKKMPHHSVVLFFRMRIDR